MEIERKYGIPEGWSEKNSGVINRHQVTFESNGYMGARAVEKALEKAKMNLKDVDLLIAADATYDYPIPNQASIIKSELRNAEGVNFGTIDIDSTCLSFVTAFDIASRMLDGNQFKNIIIVNSEISSKGLNTKNRETLTLFGDAAVATILTYCNDNESGFCKGMQRTYSEGVDYTIIRGGGNKYSFRDFPYNEELHSFEMKGIKLLKMAKRRIPEFIDDFFNDLQLKFEEIEIIIPHQASKTGLQIFKNLYQFNATQVKENLSEFGNCISASIPLVLHDLIEEKQIRRGQYCMITGTSAGFSIGGVLFKY